jgi:DNA-binding helix-hairpin-helix protein with protein kinase domain
MKHVTDVNGCKYTVGRCLGRGGQGAVYEVERSKLAIKLLNNYSVQKQEQLRNQLTQVRRLSLADLPIAKPLEILRSPYLGYVMEIVTGMVPLRAIAERPKTVDSSIEWYLGSGGLRRRLRLLARTADILAGLHSRGLVYSDVSPSNIFISEDLGANEVWFIDADNLRYQSAPSTDVYYTPGYGAPEIATGRSGVNSLSDAFGFAVLAFHTLAITHPLIGDIVVQGEPDLEQHAFEGKLPWIDDERDSRNQSSFGLPRNVVLSSRLKELFRSTFSDGLTRPTARPSVSEWADRLHTAAESTITCRECKGTFYYSADRCPWCETPRPAYAVCAFSLFDPGRQNTRKVVTRPTPQGERPVWVSRLCIAEDESVEITERQAWGHAGLRAERPLVELHFADGNLKMRRLDDGPEQIVITDGKNNKRLGSNADIIPLTCNQLSPWRIHFGSARELHRFASLKLQPGAAS